MSAPGPKPRARARRAVFLASLLGCLAAAPSARAITFALVYLDPPGEGFNDPALGAARRAAFEFAVGLWSERLAGDVPIEIELEFRGFGGSATGAFLGGALPLHVHANFTNVPRLNTWFVSALANQLAGADLLPSGPDAHDIDIVFNSDVDGPVVLGANGWYYGLDANPPPGDIDFVTVALHEIGHAMGFLHFIREATGAFFAALPDIYSAHLTQSSVGPLTAMTDAQRKASLNSEELFWTGEKVTNANAGMALEIYAPRSIRPGSSVSHWDRDITPDLLMEPFILFSKHDLDFTLPALEDMGWTILPPRLGARSWVIYRQ